MARTPPPGLPVITEPLCDSIELDLGEGRDYMRSFVCLAQVDMAALELSEVDYLATSKLTEWLK